MEERAHAELITIIAGLKEADRAYIVALDQSEILRLHHGLGRFIRNEMRGGKLPALCKWATALAQESQKPMSFDALSLPVLQEIWKSLGGCSRS